MDAAIWTAIIVAVPTVLASVVVPIVMAHLVAKQKREDREADWRRQDELDARQAARAADAAEARGKLDNKLDTIHELVNGNVSELKTRLAAAEKSVAKTAAIARRAKK